MPSLADHAQSSAGSFGAGAEAGAGMGAGAGWGAKFGSAAAGGAAAGWGAAGGAGGEPPLEWAWDSRPAVSASQEAAVGRHQSGGKPRLPSLGSSGGGGGGGGGAGADGVGADEFASTSYGGEFSSTSYAAPHTSGTPHTAGLTFRAGDTAMTGMTVTAFGAPPGERQGPGEWEGEGQGPGPGPGPGPGQTYVPSSDEAVARARDARKERQMRQGGCQVAPCHVIDPRHELTLVLEYFDLNSI